jgi:hypothetical protein
MTSEPPTPELRELGWRIPATILTAIFWLAFVIIWLFFFASQYSIWRNIAVLFVSLVITMVVMVIIWVGFGLRMGERYAKEHMGSMEYRQIRWRVMLTGLIVVAWSMFLLAWLFLYADWFSGYQNIAVLFVSILVAGGLSAILWYRYSMKRYPPQL